MTPEERFERTMALLGPPSTEEITEALGKTCLDVDWYQVNDTWIGNISLANFDYFPTGLVRLKRGCTLDVHKHLGKSRQGMQFLHVRLIAL